MTEQPSIPGAVAAAMLAREIAAPAGPWRASELRQKGDTGAHDWAASIHRGGWDAGPWQTVAYVQISGSRPLEEARAALRLMAAAPQLLQALQTAVDAMAKASPVCRAAGNAQALIALQHAMDAAAYASAAATEDNRA